MKLIRDVYDIEGTPGKVFDNSGKFICTTLERPWLNNNRNTLVPPANNSSCIPEGHYKVVKYHSTKYPSVWQILNVHDRTKILFHNANNISQLLGCVSVGSEIKNFVTDNESKIKYKYWNTSSRLTLSKLQQGLFPDEFDLEIISKDVNIKAIVHPVSF